ncbi:MAG TPA: long-chain fatty acid--CoA ligase [Bacteroidales bacterium]|jgi:long-chain acyl-CoA synthetase|nr:long-chain fatty acid--CoA ligase [Bacteroidales bacterium]
MEATRTFDIVRMSHEKYPREDMYCGKQDGKWTRYSSSECVRNTDLVSLGLLSMGFVTGDKIGTITPNKPEWNFADQGIAQAGMIHVPIYPTIGSDEYAFILDHSDIKALIVGNKTIYNKVSPILSKAVRKIAVFSFDPVEGVSSFSDIIEAGRRNESKLRHELESISSSIKPNDLVTIIYTSGTTGTSKGVMLSHENLLSNVRETIVAHELGYGHRAMSFLPLCHVLERMLNYHFQYKGISIYYVENMGTVGEMIKEIKPHIFATVPRLLEKVYDNIISKGRSLPWLKRKIFFWAVALGLKFRLKGNSGFYKFRLKVARKLIFSKWKEALGNELVVVVSGGAALQSRLERIFWAAGVPIIQGYGLTETSPVIAVNPFRLGEIKFETVGPILNGVEVRLAEDGEILAKGPNLMLGYYKAPDLTAEVIDSEGWFHTGDIGVLEENKWLRITDRKKEMFKLSAGKYIAPQSIENRLKESPFIEQAMVIGENEKFASALISPNFAYLHDWCASHKLHFRDNSDLIEMAEVINQFSREIKEINGSIGEHEQIKRFRLVTEEWSTQSGELSPTLKLKRNLIARHYKEIIADIYSRDNSDVNVLIKIRNGINIVLRNLPKF